MLLPMHRHTRDTMDESRMLLQVASRSDIGWAKLRFSDSPDAEWRIGAPTLVKTP
jgi:hypothetical protein